MPRSRCFIPSVYLTLPMKRSGPPTSELQRLKLKVCPVCGKKGSGPYWKPVYNKVHKRYTYPFFAHYKGTRGKTRIILWCYISKKLIIATFEEEERARGDER